jgi:peptidoglycan/LPS O-acetylase OafA/YrhL
VNESENLTNPIHPGFKANYSIYENLTNIIPKISFEGINIRFETSLVPAFWTVIIEICFYVYLSALVKLNKFTFNLVIGLTFTLWLIKGLNTAYNFKNDISKINSEWYFTVVGGIGYYLVGVVAYLYLSKTQTSKKRKNYGIFAKTAPIQLLLLLTFYPHLVGQPESFPTQNSILNWLSFSLLTTYLTINTLKLDFQRTHSNPNYKIKKDNLGILAYGVYVFQILPIILLEIFYQRTQIIVPIAAKFAICTVIVSLISFITNNRKNKFLN